ncbi:hypothetical protein J3R30DRAFT_1591137 [Lentinula aciculospora]|uniref:Uncharacterized protein n=1 Tax=Lentinula aciculospora TaxID=153920 RepID=A0A9W9DH69_9AGAR|nr:hypothetical protein J3R30DRAFT_1591137 [Lentinula aciculospora]
MSASGTPSETRNNGRSSGQPTSGSKRKESSDSFALSLQEAMNASTSHNAVVGDYYTESQTLPRRGQGQGRGRGRGSASATRGQSRPSQPLSIQTEIRTHSPSRKPRRADGPQLTPVAQKKPVSLPSREASPVRIPGDVLALQKDAHGDEMVTLYVGRQWDVMAFPGLFEFEFEDETNDNDPLAQDNLATNSGSVRMLNTRWIRQSNESRQAMSMASGENEGQGPRLGNGKGKFVPPLSLSLYPSSARLSQPKPDATADESFEEYWLPGDHEQDEKDKSSILSALDISSDSEDTDSTVDLGPQRRKEALTTISALTSTDARTEWPEGEVTYYCHQCHRSTNRVYMNCKNEGAKCKIKYCVRCIS